MKHHYSIFWILLIFSAFTYAEDTLDDPEFDDFEFEFSIQQKSTIDDFPMQEIGQEELSNTAVEGALSTRAALKSKKPIYEEKKEENEQNLSKEADKTNEEVEQSEIDKMLKFSDLQIPVQQYQEPIYTEPNGRTYTEHNTHTLDFAKFRG